MNRIKLVLIVLSMNVSIQLCWAQIFYINFRIQTETDVNHSLEVVEVQQIDSLHISGYKNEFDLDFGRFANLSYCEIYSDTIANVPDQLFSLPRLSHLYFSSYKPLIYLPESLRNNYSIKEFGMYFELNEHNISVLESMDSIRKLQIDGSFIPYLQYVTGLKYLDISCSKNELKYFYAASGYFSQLQGLAIRSEHCINLNQIKCPALKYLYLFEKHKFDPTNPPSFLTQITKLRLARISDRKCENLDILYACPNVDSLEIGYFKVKTSALDCKKVPNLELIEISWFDSKLINDQFRCPNLRVVRKSYQNKKSVL